MELTIAQDERISAPLHLVWDELGSLDRILAKTPLMSRCEIVPDGGRARAKADLAWGPFRWTVELDVMLLGLIDQRQIRYVIEAKRMAARAETTVDLVPTGQIETKLAYCELVEVGRRAGGQLRRLVKDMAEEHAHNFLHKVKVKSEQRWLAHERLLD